MKKDDILSYIKFALMVVFVYAAIIAIILYSFDKMDLKGQIKQFEEQEALKK